MSGNKSAVDKNDLASSLKGTNVNNAIRANRAKSLMNWLIIGISFASIIIGLVILATGDKTVQIYSTAIVHYTSEPAIINLLVAISALFATVLAIWGKFRLSPLPLLILISIITITDMFTSLLFRDDYTGGSCGDFEWPAGHLHAGYPYSWIDGEICVPPNTSISVYTSQNPEKAGWFPDLRAILVDLLFWANIGILACSFLGLAKKLRERKKDSMIGNAG